MRADGEGSGASKERARTVSVCVCGEACAMHCACAPIVKWSGRAAVLLATTERGRVRWPVLCAHVYGAELSWVAREVRGGCRVGRLP